MMLTSIIFILVVSVVSWALEDVWPVDLRRDTGGDRVEGSKFGASTIAKFPAPIKLLSLAAIMSEKNCGGKKVKLCYICNHRNNCLDKI